MSTIGTFGASEQLTAIEAAIAAGVYRFLPSEYGGNTSLEGVINYPPFALDKKRVIDRLHEAEANGLTWTALCTGIFFSWVSRVNRNQQKFSCVLSFSQTDRPNRFSNRATGHLVGTSPSARSQFTTQAISNSTPAPLTSSFLP